MSRSHGEKIGHADVSMVFSCDFVSLFCVLSLGCSGLVVSKSAGDWLERLVLTDRDVKTCSSTRWAVVTTTIRLRLDCSSTGRRLFDVLRDSRARVGHGSLFQNPTNPIFLDPTQPNPNHHRHLVWRIRLYRKSEQFDYK